MKNLLKRNGRRWWRQRGAVRRNAPWRGALGLAWDTCNTGWPAHEANDWIGWTGRINPTLRALTDGKPRPVCNAEAWLCGVNCDKATWDSLARRPSRMRCGPNVLQARSERFVAAYQRRRAAREDHAPGRRPFPKRWTLDLHQRPRGMVIYLRRTDEFGAIRVLGHRLVRAEVDLEAQQIRCYRLRRRAPDEQPLVRTIKYVFPEKQFHPT